MGEGGGGGLGGVGSWLFLTNCRFYPMVDDKEAFLVRAVDCIKHCHFVVCWQNQQWLSNLQYQINQIY